MKWIGRAFGLFVVLILLSMCFGMSQNTSREPVTKSTIPEKSNERWVKVKKIIVKNKTIRLGMTSDEIVALLPAGAAMDNIRENADMITTNYYYGDKYFKLVFYRGDGPYRVVDMFEKIFE